jgi:MFS family permease
MTHPRVAGAPQGIILILVPLFAMLGAVLMAPILATMQAYFKDTPHADVLVPMLLTTPALCLALLSPFAGMLGDRIGARPIALWSLGLYAIAGTSPMYLPSLYWIFASRLLVGVAEAGLVASSMVLLSAYFNGDERQKWIAYQNAALPWIAALLIGITGRLGNLSWRVTFAMYALSLLVLIAAIRYLFEPSQSIGRAAEQAAERASGLRLPPWRPLLRIIAIAVPGSIAFYAAPIELAFLLELQGQTAPSTSANVTAVCLVIGPFGALLSRKLTHLSVGKVLAIAMSTMGVGLIVMAVSRNVPSLAVGMVIQQMGGGLMLVTGMTYVLSLAKPHERGLYSGAWWFFYMLSQFVTPVVMSALLALTGTRTSSVIVAGVLILATCVWLLFAGALRRAVVVSDQTAFEHG